MVVREPLNQKIGMVRLVRNEQGRIIARLREIKYIYIINFVYIIEFNGSEMLISSYGQNVQNDAIKSRQQRRIPESPLFLSSRLAEYTGSRLTKSIISMKFRTNARIETKNTVQALALQFL